MYSILLSKMEIGFPLIENKLKSIIKENDKVVIIPWSFPKETNTKGLEEYIKEKINPKYILPLIKLGINSKNIKCLNCYSDEETYVKKLIASSNILILTGGNPEMLYNKIKQYHLLETISSYNKIIIGSSAGAVLQFNNYFITAKNNYYQKFAWYKGIGVIKNNFYIDVHSSSDNKYLEELKEQTKKNKKDIYLIFDDGVIIYNRKDKKIYTYGHVQKIPNDLKQNLEL